MLLWHAGIVLGTLQKWRMVWGLHTSYHKTQMLALTDRQRNAKREKEAAFSVLNKLLMILSVNKQILNI